MKKLLLLALAAAVVAPLSAKPAARFKNPGIAKKAAVAVTSKQRVPRKNASNAVWRPGHEVVSAWEDEWFEYEAYDITYTGGTAALVATELCTDLESGSQILTVNTWNDNGLLAEQLLTTSGDGETFENSERTARTYDSVITDYITENYQWLWYADAWQQSGNNYTQTLTRDGAGNVTEVVRAIYFQGIFDPTYRLVIEYTDGKAIKITQNDLSYDYATSQYVWNQTAVLSDIVWETTDGQITDIDDIYLGANRILSGHLANTDSEVDITAEYPSEGVAIIRHEGMVQGYEDASMTITYQTLPNGGFTQTTAYTVEEDGEEYTETYTDTENYDAYGNLILLSSTGEAEGEEWVEQLVEGEVEYDEEFGYPLVYSVKMAEFDEETDEMTMVWLSRSEYSEYTDVAGLEAPAVAADTNAAPAWFNLSGLRVNPATLTPGIYIVRRGDKAEKQIVR